ncbi:hypothetical protein BGZ88_006503 [Linnemannia elongata]|nr:hypothetical protein BGZ88_006503 [Linnemannia elongata]
MPPTTIIWIPPEVISVVSSYLDQHSLAQSLLVGSGFEQFSLASGLELLGGMEELRVLDVRSTAHRIGIVDLDWMHVNWPKLKEIKGLVSKREWAGDVPGGLAVKAAVEEWMAAHPHGIGSSFYL